MSLRTPYLLARFGEIDTALAKAVGWGRQDPELDAYLAGYLVVLLCGIFEDCIEHLLLERVRKTNDKELVSFVGRRVSQTFRNPDSGRIATFLEDFSSSYKDNYKKRVTDSSAAALSSIVSNKNWLAHGETKKLQITIGDVTDFYLRSIPVFEAVEQILV